MISDQLYWAGRTDSENMFKVISVILKVLVSITFLASFVMYILSTVSSNWERTKYHYDASAVTPTDKSGKVNILEKIKRMYRSTYSHSGLWTDCRTTARSGNKETCQELQNKGKRLQNVFFT